MKFMACQSCFACRMKDDCVINDELHEALQKVKSADAVVIGSPIYMMQMTGPVKNLYDRLFPLMDLQGRPRFGAKKMITVYSQGMDDEHAYDSYFEYTAAMYPSFGFELVDNIVCTGRQRPGARGSGCGAEDPRLRGGQGARADGLEQAELPQAGEADAHVGVPAVLEHHGGAGGARGGHHGRRVDHAVAQPQVRVVVVALAVVVVHVQVAQRALAGRPATRRGSR